MVYLFRQLRGYFCLIIIIYRLILFKKEGEKIVVPTFIWTKINLKILEQEYVQSL